MKLFTLTLLCGLIFSLAASTPASWLLVNGVLRIQPGQFLYYQFTGNHLRGFYRAHGGAHNDIDVLVIDAQSFQAYTNGNSVQCYYCPGQRSADSFDLRLPGGEYVLIYSNGMSVVSGKAVETRMDIN